jgi:hypothetical protein
MPDFSTPGRDKIILMRLWTLDRTVAPVETKTAILDERRVGENVD